MTNETKTDFNDRRALDEKLMSDRATDVVQTIAHDQLSELHAQEARDGDHADAPMTTALDVTAVDGVVAVSDANGDVTRLTPNAANLTSDLLLAVAHDAGRQCPTPAPHSPEASRSEPTAAERAR